MSDYNPFGAAPESSDVVEEEAARGSRKAIVAVGALAAVVLGAGAFLLLGGDADEELDTAAPPARAAAPAPAAAAPEVGTTLPVATDYTLGRNPFRALYIQPAAATTTPTTDTGTGTTGGDTGTDTGGTVLPNTGGTSTPTTGSTGTGGTGSTPSAPTAQEYKLILLRVFGEGPDLSASFSIDGSEQTAKVGSTFGMHMEILLVELTEAPTGEWTATLQVGDGDPFDVTTGEPAYVR